MEMVTSRFDRAENEDTQRISKKPAHSAVSRSATRTATKLAKANYDGAFLLFKQVVEVGVNNHCSTASIKVAGTEVQVSFSREEPGEARGWRTTRAQSAGPAGCEYPRTGPRMLRARGASRHRTLHSV